MTDQKHFDARISVLTAGRDRHYALGFACALLESGLRFEFVGSDDLESEELSRSALVNVLNLHRDRSWNACLSKKMLRVAAYYIRLFLYASRTRAKLLHILWNNKFELFDRTVLMAYYKLLGKQIVLTAHNVNARARDGGDSVLNRATLRFQYRVCDHILVHTEKMREELISHFGVLESAVSVIPYGFNNKVPDTELTCAAAKEKVGLGNGQKVVLFFGMIAPYKGLEFLLQAMAMVLRSDPSFRLVIVGKPKNCARYWESIQGQIRDLGLQNFVVQRIEFLPDPEIEVYFKAADVLVLPYTYIFQSGILSLGYSFGLPVIASDVGSLKECIINDETGYICQPQDPADLARALNTYFSSNLYHQLEKHRARIRAFAAEEYSWEKVAKISNSVYTRLLGKAQPKVLERYEHCQFN